MLTDLPWERGLAAKLTFRQEEGSNVIRPAGVERFWSEHSERATLPSWAATLNFPQAWLGNLGRWGARRSAAYVRTVRVWVMVMQSKTADAIRCASDPGSMVGEQVLMEQLATFLLEQRVFRLDSAEGVQHPMPEGFARVQNHIRRRLGRHARTHR